MNKRYLYLALAAILGLFIGGRWNIPLAAWIAPIFVIRFFRDSDKAGRNFLLLHADNVGKRPPNTIGIRYTYRGEDKEVILKSDYNTSELIELKWVSKL